MAGRIAVAVLALITALLAVVAIPLGLLISAQDRGDFQAGTATAATTVANVAEERLDDGVHGTALSRSIREMGRRGDELAVYDSAGHLIAGTARRPAVSRSVRSAVRSQVTYPSGNRLVVLAPVVRDRGYGSVGTVALSRFTMGLDHRIMVVWALIGGVAAAGLAVQQRATDPSLVGLGAAARAARGTCRALRGTGLTDQREPGEDDHDAFGDQCRHAQSLQPVPDVARIAGHRGTAGENVTGRGEQADQTAELQISVDLRKHPWSHDAAVVC